MITSLQNDRVKLVHALQTRAKARRKEGRIALEGLRLVRDALHSGHRPDFLLLTPGEADPDFARLLDALHIQPALVTPEVMRHISDTQQPQGIVAVFPTPSHTPPPQPGRVLILDGIRDPGNMGTILRTAGAAGVQVVLLSPTCVDPYNPKTLRGGMGAHFRLPLVEMDWGRITHSCAGLVVYLADSHGDKPYDAVDWSVPWALIIGSEAHGAGDEAARLAHSRIHIPMAAATESLNAGVAAGIILFEAAKQPRSPL